VGGILGTILTGVFAAAAFGGAGFAEGRTLGGQVLIQLGGVLATAAWSGVLTWVLLKVTDATVGMRVAGDEETEGLDTVLHNEKGYNL
jgi:Amt family ammonium transporter